MSARNLVMLGTKKGVFVLRSEDGRRNWKSSGPHFEGTPVYHATYDPRNKVMIATIGSFIKGPTLAKSKDLGKTWKEGRKPPRFPKGSDWSVKQIWHIEPGPEDEPGVVYAGVDPAALFRSEDAGDTWRLVEGLYNQKTRKKWTAGAGGLCLHSILVDPRDPGTIHVAISAVGIMKSTDGGETWAFKNKNIRADFSPNKFPVFGQCAHHIVRHPSRPDVIYQQNHCGQYRSDDNGETWKDIESNLPSRFGFPIGVDYNDPKRVFVAPEVSGAVRLPPGGRFLVWASDDQGRTWEAMGNGLPKRSYYGVYREGMDTDEEDPCGVYVGTSTGQLLFSRNAGRAWTLVADGLPPILSVSAATA
jgi:photosystem II stability/assembly factor-like uncharacterized protein